MLLGSVTALDNGWLILWSSSAFGRCLDLPHGARCTYPSTRPWTPRELSSDLSYGYSHGHLTDTIGAPVGLDDVRSDISTCSLWSARDVQSLACGHGGSILHRASHLDLHGAVQHSTAVMGRLSSSLIAVAPTTRIAPIDTQAGPRTLRDGATGRAHRCLQ